MRRLFLFFTAFILLGALSGCEEPLERPPHRLDDAGVDDVPIYDPPVRGWSVYVVRVVTGNPTAGGTWDPPTTTVDLGVTARAGKATFTTPVEAKRAVTAGRAAALWLDPVLENVPAATLASDFELALFDDDGSTRQAIASCQILVPELTLEAGVLRTKCAPASPGYAGAGWYDVVLGFRVTGDDSIRPGDAPGMWELRLTKFDLNPVDALGKPWDNDATAADISFDWGWIENVEGVDVEIHKRTALPDDMNVVTPSAPLLIARVPDAKDPFDKRWVPHLLYVWDRDGAVLTSTKGCEGALYASGFPDLPASGVKAVNEDCSYACCVNNCNCSQPPKQWHVELEERRVGTGWL